MVHNDPDKKLLGAKLSQLLGPNAYDRIYDILGKKTIRRLNAVLFPKERTDADIEEEITVNKDNTTSRETRVRELPNISDNLAEALKQFVAGNSSVKMFAEMVRKGLRKIPLQLSREERDKLTEKIKSVASIHNNPLPKKTSLEKDKVLRKISPILAKTIKKIESRPTTISTPSVSAPTSSIGNAPSSGNITSTINIPAVSTPAVTVDTTTQTPDTTAQPAAPTNTEFDVQINAAPTSSQPPVSTTPPAQNQQPAVQKQTPTTRPTSAPPHTPPTTSISPSAAPTNAGNAPSSNTSPTAPPTPNQPPTAATIDSRPKNKARTKRKKNGQKIPAQIPTTANAPAPQPPTSGTATPNTGTPSSQTAPTARPAQTTPAEQPYTPYAEKTPDVGREFSGPAKKPAATPDDTTAPEQFEDEQPFQPEEDEEELTKPVVTAKASAKPTSTPQTTATEEQPPDAALPPTSAKTETEPSSETAPSHTTQTKNQTQRRTPVATQTEPEISAPQPTNFDQPPPPSSQSQGDISQPEGAEETKPEEKTKKPSAQPTAETATGEAPPSAPPTPSDETGKQPNEILPTEAKKELTTNEQVGAGADMAKDQNRERRNAAEEQAPAQPETPGAPTAGENANAIPKDTEAPLVAQDEYSRPIDEKSTGAPAGTGGEPATINNTQAAAGDVARDRQQRIKQLQNERKDLETTIKEFEKGVNSILKPPPFQFSFTSSWAIMLAKTMVRSALNNISGQMNQKKGRAKLAILKTAVTTLLFLKISLTILKKTAALIETLQMWGWAVGATAVETLGISLIILIPLLPVFLIIGMVLDIGKMPATFKPVIKKVTDLSEKFKLAIKEEEKKLNAKTRLQQVKKELKILLPINKK